jgi:hypothetical protein
VRRYELSTFVINPLIHFYQKKKIAAKFASVNRYLNTSLQCIILDKEISSDVVK